MCNLTMHFYGRLNYYQYAYYKMFYLFNGGQFTWFLLVCVAYRKKCADGKKLPQGLRRKIDVLRHSSFLNVLTLFLRFQGK